MANDTAILDPEQATSSRGALLAETARIATEYLDTIGSRSVAPLPEAVTWEGRAAMRISVSSWATTAADVDRSLDAMVKLARSA